MNHFPKRPLALAIALGLCALAAPAAFAQDAPKDKDGDAPSQLPVVTVSATADKQGLSKAYAGGQVARGGRAGILGTKDNLETPFSITAYTNELIQDRQARSVAEVLQNDPGIRAARGFGNFQEAYFIRGFILNSDDVAYNGLYSLLPRQYIASELFERVEVLRGASAFLMGASPNGSGIGGNISLLPKRAPVEPLTRLTVNAGSGGAGGAALDVARRFGPDKATGVRFNAAYRDGGTAVRALVVQVPPGQAAPERDSEQRDHDQPDAGGTPGEAREEAAHGVSPSGASTSTFQLSVPPGAEAVDAPLPSARSYAVVVEGDTSARAPRNRRPHDAGSGPRAEEFGHGRLRTPRTTLGSDGATAQWARVSTRRVVRTDGERRSRAGM